MVNGVHPKAAYCPRDDVFVTEVGGELVLFDPSAGQYFGSGEVGARIWRHLAEGLSVEEVSAALTDEFDVDEMECRDDVTAFVAALLENALVTVKAAPHSPD